MVVKHKILCYWENYKLIILLVRVKMVQLTTEQRVFIALRAALNLSANNYNRTTKMLLTFMHKIRFDCVYAPMPMGSVYMQGVPQKTKLLKKRIVRI